MKQLPPTPLARHRMSRGWSQKEFARVIGVKPSAACKWETGRARPEPKRIPEIARALNIDPLRVAEMLGMSPEERK
jgi:transcriptional regulator with XRE-family HTH domain